MKTGQTAEHPPQKTISPLDMENVSPANPLKLNRTWRQKLAHWWKERRNPHRTLMVNMELINGFHRSFIIVEREGGFQYRGGKYLFDSDSKYYNNDAKLWCYDYHEMFALPIKRIIPVTHVQAIVESIPSSEVEYSTNPKTLERFITAKIAEGIMKGQAIDEWMKQIRVMILIALVAAIIHLILFMQKTGMLQQLSGKLPF